MNRFEIKPFKGRMLWAMLGALVLGVAVPVLLVSLYMSLKVENRDFMDFPPDPDDVAEMEPLTNEFRLRHFLEGAGVLSLGATLYCGPGCLILAYWLMRKARRWTDAFTMPQVLRAGVLSGVGISMLNFPGWLVLPFLIYNFHEHDYTLATLQTFALFIVTGGTCGLWLAWQAWRERHPEAGAFPRFSLRTLIALAFAWGLLIMLFVPQQA